MDYCIYIPIFEHFSDVRYALLLLESLYIYGNIYNKNYHNIDIIINTTEKFKKKIMESYLYDNNIIFEINEKINKFDLFDLKIIDKYDKILYLDPKTIIKTDVKNFFDLVTTNTIYTNNSNNFNIMLFTNNSEIKIYFNILRLNDIKNLKLNFVNKNLLTDDNIVNFTDNSIYNYFINHKENTINSIINKCKDININNDNKYKNIVNIFINKKIKNVLYICSNLSNDILLMLITNPDIKITCVLNDYDIEFYNKIKESFPNSLNIIKGDSTDILPFLKDKYDLIYVDTNAQQFMMINDFINSYHLASDYSLFLMNNYKKPDINNVWNLYSAKLRFREPDINIFTTDSHIIKFIKKY